MKVRRRKFWIIFCIAVVLASAWTIRYKAVNRDYRQRWSANTEEIFAFGETVPVGTDFMGSKIQAEGYELTVTDFEIVDYGEYTSALDYSGADRRRLPDRIALVGISLSQHDSQAEGFPLTELVLYTVDVLFNVDWELLDVINPGLEGSSGIRLQDGASFDVVLPFDIYRYRFSASEWDELEQSDIWLKVTNYPARKIIHVQEAD